MERLAAALSARAELHGVRPGSPPSRVARALGYRVRVEDLGGELHGWLLESVSVICVDGSTSSERREFSIAHELMHAEAPASVPADQLEAWCDRGAAALMMPRQAFLESGTACGWDVGVLRAWWPHCSLTALERRIWELGARVVVVDEAVRRTG